MNSLGYGTDVEDTEEDQEGTVFPEEYDVWIDDRLTYND